MKTVRSFGNVPDLPLFCWALAATILGAGAVFDAGYARSIESSRGIVPREFLTQVVFSIFAVGAAWMCMRVRAETWQKLGVASLLMTIALLFAVDRFGLEQNGAKRWLNLYILQIQPAEFAKLATVMFLAAIFCKHAPLAPLRRLPRNWAEWLDMKLCPFLRRAMPAFVVTVAFLLIENEPDLGTGAVIAVIAYGMFWLGGVGWKHMLAIIAIAAVGATILVVKQPYRLDRVVNHVRRWEERNMDDVGYQTTQSETGMASGGMVGVGLGSGRTKYIIPAPTSDFITSTIGEETGFLGSLTVLFVLGGLTFRLINLAKRASDRFAQLLLGGTAIWIGVQSCVNIMMANGALPPIGIPLPFFSSGGSSLLALWMAVGVCQSVVVQQQPQEVQLEDRNHRWRDRRARLSRA